MRVEQSGQNPEETTTPPQEDHSKYEIYATIFICIGLVVLGSIFKLVWMWGIGLAGLFVNCVVLCLCTGNPSKT